MFGERNIKKFLALNLLLMPLNFSDISITLENKGNESAIVEQSRQKRFDKFNEDYYELEDLSDRPIYSRDDLSKIRSETERLRRIAIREEFDENYLNWLDEIEIKREDMDRNFIEESRRELYTSRIFRRQLLDEILENHMDNVSSGDLYGYENDLIPGSSLMISSTSIDLFYLRDFYYNSHRVDVRMGDLENFKKIGIINDNQYEPQISYSIPMYKYRDEVFDTMIVIEQLSLTNEGYKVTYITAQNKYYGDRLRYPIPLD